VNTPEGTTANDILQLISAVYQLTHLLFFDLDRSEFWKISASFLRRIQTHQVKCTNPASLKTTANPKLSHKTTASLYFATTLLQKGSNQLNLRQMKLRKQVLMGRPLRTVNRRCAARIRSSVSSLLRRAKRSRCLWSHYGLLFAGLRTLEWPTTPVIKSLMS
jgi:hypothetical protein